MRRKLVLAGIVTWGLIAALLVGIFVLMLTGVVSVPSFVAPDKIDLLREESFPLDGLVDLNIRCRTEDIRVTLSDGDIITVRQYGSADADLLFTSERTGSALTISIPARSLSFSCLFRFWSNAYLEVALPSSYAQRLELTAVSGSVNLPGFVGSAITLSSVSGDIQVGNVAVTGDATLKNTSGDIRAADIQAQNASLKTVSGDIRCGTLTLEGQAELGTTSGDIRADALHSQTYDVHSISGDISLQSALAGGGRLHTVSGNINAAGVVVTNPITAGSTSGDIRLALAYGQHCEFKMKSTSGDLRSNAPISRNRKEANGTVGDGGPDISASTVSGDITVDVTG
ncbi:MAG: DUF4097 domain-containing protein [Oscillospiraceae bacterium]|nr:DUF4097 domain-containing protein [Oscillospiraceae bacterium]